MTRAMTIALALAACALCVEAALFVAGVAGTWFHVHRLAPWFVPACNLVLVFCFVFTGRSDKRSAVEDEGLTPLVRRDPKTGLRQL
jgi:hypothetical protein